MRADGREAQAARRDRLPASYHAAGLISTRTAVWLALGLGLAVLAAQGITFARIERLGWVATLVVVAVNVGLGVLLVGLKLLVVH